VSPTIRLAGVLAAVLCAVVIAPSAAGAYASEPEGARLDSSAWNANPHIVLAWPSSGVGDLQVDAVSDENGASSTWTITLMGQPPAALTVVSPCAAVPMVGGAVITCTVSAAELAQGLEVWTSDGLDLVSVTDAGSNADIAPAALFPRGVNSGGSQKISGGRGADLLSTAEENTGTPGVAWVLGGIGHDTFVGSPNSLDVIGYEDVGRTGGVSAKLDCLANDGNAVLDVGSEDVGCSSTSIEALEGTNSGDVLVGDDASNSLYGLGGDDYLKGMGATDNLSGGNGVDILTGGSGSDTFYGDDSPFDRFQDGPAGDGDDTVNADDGVPDHAIDCGGSGGDVAKVDDVSIDSDSIVNCETVSRAAAPAGGTGGANPGNPPSGLVDRVPVVNTTRTYVLGDLRGYTLDEIALLFWLGGVNADFRGSKAVFKNPKNLPRHPRGERWRIGDVIGHITPIGRPLSHSAGQPAKIDLQYWMGLSREGCLSEAKNFKGLNIDEFKNTMTDLGCKVDDLLPAFTNRVKGDDKCEVAKILRGDSSRAVDAVVNIPRDPAKHDLFIGIGSFKAVKSQAPNSRSDAIGGPLAPDWTLPRSNKTSFSGAVIARTGNWVGNVTVYVDTSGVKSATSSDSFHVTTSTKSDSPGQFTTPLFTAGKEGTVDVLALGIDRNGGAVCGATQIKVKDFKRKSGTLLTNINGRVYQYTPGEGKPFTVRNDLVGKSASTGGPVARTAASWWDGVVGWWNQLWSGKPNAQAAPSQNTAGTAGRGVVQFAPGRALSSAAAPATVTVAPMVAAGGLNETGSGGSGQMVAAGAGNLVFATTGMVAAGAGNMVAAGAGNLVAAGGGNIGGPVVDVSRSSIRDVSGVKLIGQDGATMVAAGAGNMVAAGAGNMVAAGAGNLVAAGGGN
jgi:hypothetical protein